MSVSRCVKKIAYESDTSSLIEPNKFWFDFAKFVDCNETIPFLSKYFWQCVGSINQILCAIAVLDLPLESSIESDDNQIPIPCIVFRQEMTSNVMTHPTNSGISIASFYFRRGHETGLDAMTGETFDQFMETQMIEDGKECFVFEFEIVYGCTNVITNGTSKIVCVHEEKKNQLEKTIQTTRLIWKS